MTPDVGRVAILRGDSGMYMVLILTPSLRCSERWRCLVLVDDINVDDAGLVVEYNDMSLTNFFDQLM